MDHAEKVAKLVVETALPGTKLNYRPEQSYGEYDFDLQHPDGSVAALEVTSSTDQKARQTYAAIGDKKKGGSTLKATQCRKSWIIFPAPNPPVNQIRQKADSYLSRLESAGIFRFSWSDRKHAEVNEICRDLKLRAGSAIDVNPTQIRMAYPLGGGAVGRSAAIKAGNEEAWKEDNRKKLRSTGANERHLFVYIDSPSRAWISLTQFEPPPTLPELPSEITDIWLASENGSKFMVWKASSSTYWSSQIVPWRES